MHTGTLPTAAGLDRSSFPAKSDELFPMGFPRGRRREPPPRRTMMHLPFSPTGVCQHTQFFARPSPPLAPANHEAGPARRGRHAKRAPTGRISWHAGRHLSLGQGIGIIVDSSRPFSFLEGDAHFQRGPSSRQCGHDINRKYDHRPSHAADRRRRMMPPSSPHRY